MRKPATPRIVPLFRAIDRQDFVPTSIWVDPVNLTFDTMGSSPTLTRDRGLEDSKGLSRDPTAFRQSGYLERITKQRQPGFADHLLVRVAVRVVGLNSDKAEKTGNSRSQRGIRDKCGTADFRTA